MRYNAFLALLTVAFVLDAVFIALSIANPSARLFQPRVAVAAPPPATFTPTAIPPTTTPSPTPTTAPTNTPVPTATSTPLPTATQVPTALPTATQMPEPQVLADHKVAFTPSDRAVRANIRLALAHYSAALTRVVLGPGETFSFNAALGLRPQRLPWKYVRVKPNVPEASSDGSPNPEPDAQLVQGGGICDLASRYVMAARPLLPAKAFRFVNHVRSNGQHLAGVPARDSVSIWAVGGGPGEQDLKITNTTQGWMEWRVQRDGETITVSALLWSRQPPP